MGKDVQIVPENIILFHINILKSEIREKGKERNPKYDLNVAHTTMHNLKDERIKITLMLNLSDDKNKKGNEVNFEIEFHYSIKDLKNFYELENDQPVFSANLIATILGISFSTARGMLYERLANTNFQGVILPVISPIKMLSTKTKSE